jgi:hypothetical protein
VGKTRFLPHIKYTDCTVPASNGTCRRRLFAVGLYNDGVSNNSVCLFSDDLQM